MGESLQITFRVISLYSQCTVFVNQHPNKRNIKDNSHELMIYLTELGDFNIITE